MSGATKLDVSKPTLAVAVVATTVVSATPGLSDALAGSDASWAPTATTFTPLPGLSVETLGVSSTSGSRRDYRWFRSFLGSYYTWTFTKT